MALDSIVISNIPVKIPHTDVLRRLGYRIGQEPDCATESLIAEVSSEALILAQPKGLYLIYDMNVFGDTVKIGFDGCEILSAYLTKLVKDCKFIAIMAVSLGVDICEKIHYYMTDGKSPSKGVILDAVASELAEATMEYLHSIIKMDGIRKGYKTTIRYSPGYKDFALSSQKTIDDLLSLEKIGINITSHFLLYPEKSITAVAGWEQNHV